MGLTERIETSGLNADVGSDGREEDGGTKVELTTEGGLDCTDVSLLSEVGADETGREEPATD